MCSIIKEARKTGIKRGRSPMCRRGGPGNPPRISMKYRIGSVVLFEWRVRLEPWQVAVTLGYQFLYRICGPCTCHSVTQRRSSQCAEAGTPSVTRVSRIWFLASLPLLHGDGKKERCLLMKLPLNAIDEFSQMHLRLEFSQHLVLVLSCTHSKLILILK